MKYLREINILYKSLVGSALLTEHKQILSKNIAWNEEKNQRAHTIHCIFFNSKNNCLPCKGQSFLIRFRYVWIRMYCIWLYGGYIASFFFLIHKTIVIVSARKWTAASTYLLSRICTYSVSQQHTNINNWEFYVSFPKKLSYSFPHFFVRHQSVTGGFLSIVKRTLPHYMEMVNLLKPYNPQYKSHFLRVNSMWTSP